MTDQDLDRPVAWDAATSSYSAAALRGLHRRLRLFSYVVARPKTPEGDSLQLAFRVSGRTAGAALLASWGLVAGPDLQRPAAGPFAGAALLAQLEQHPAGPDGDPVMDRWIAIVRLWNERAVYDVTPRLVASAEAVEQRLRALHVDALPRETRLHCWLTPERWPQYFA